MVPHFPENALAVDLLFQPAQCLLNRFAFFKSDLCQSDLTSSLSGLRRPLPGMSSLDLAQGDTLDSSPATVNGQLENLNDSFITGS